MNPDLVKLIELQKIDSQVIEKRKEIEAIPLQIKKLRKKVSEVEDRFKKAKAKAEEIEKKRRQKEIELQEAIERINKLKDRTSEIKTNEEYQAHLKEIEKAEKKKFLIEDDILYLMEEAERVDGEIKKVREEIEREKGQILSEERDLQERMKILEAEVSQLLTQRQGIVKDLDTSLYNAYMELLENGNGVAVAEARDEVCQGCYMSIPPQLFVELKTKDEIFTCPQCGRFLYRSDAR